MNSLIGGTDGELAGTVGGSNLIFFLRYIIPNGAKSKLPWASSEINTQGNLGSGDRG